MDRFLSAILYRLDNEKTVSKGIGTSSVKSEERFHCFSILGFNVSPFWADKTEEAARRNIIERCLIIIANIENMKGPAKRRALFYLSYIYLFDTLINIIIQVGVVLS
jgi:hypothetical protein